MYNRMNEEIILTNNKMHIQVYKEPEVLIYTLDKVFDVLDNNDTISIILSIYFKNLNPCFILVFISNQKYVSPIEYEKTRILNSMRHHILTIS